MDQSGGLAGRTGEVYGTKVKIVLTEVVNDQVLEPQPEVPFHGQPPPPKAHFKAPPPITPQELAEADQHLSKDALLQLARARGLIS